MENASGQLYWNSRWKSRETGWDIGYPSPAIAAYIDQYENKNAAILIPGCGNAYEAEYIVKCGFTNITLLDIAPQAVEHLKGKFASAPAVKIICEDFFRHKGNYDLVLEQTFFCALPPNSRADYVKKMGRLLNKNGRLAGVLFSQDFEKPGPPFGGTPSEYLQLFSPYFLIRRMEPCYNSIPQREGAEVFISMVKKP